MYRGLSFGLALALPLVLACGDDASTGGEADAANDAEPVDAGLDVGARPSSPRCNAPDPALEPESVPRCEPSGTGTRHVFVLDGWDLSFPDAEGFVHGFDLDERESTGADAESCFHEDSTSPPPESTPGVDAQVGIILSDLSLDDNLSQGYAASIDSGEILPLLVLDDVDDLSNDDCVHVGLTFGRLPAGEDAPVQNAEGRFEPGQTFDLRAEWLESDRTTPRVRLLDGRIDGGVVTASGPEARAELPFPPDYVVTEVIYYGVRLRFSVSGEAVTGGVVGGMVEPGELLAALAEGLDPVLESSVEAVLRERADMLLVDETCTCLSLAFVMDGVPCVAGATVD